MSPTNEKKYLVETQQLQAISAFSEVKEIPPDPIFALTAGYKADINPNKINVGVGAYRTEEGLPWPLPVVKKAQALIAADPKRDFEYLPIRGLPEFVSASVEFLLGGKENPAVLEGRAAGVQSLSGTGALRLGAEFLKRFSKFASKKVYIPNPTWIIHKSLFPEAGLSIAEYPYYNSAENNLDFDGMIQALRNADDESIIVLHVCAHNPTGIDPTQDQWLQIGNLIKEKKHFTFFDCAYQGFASGDLLADSFPVRLWTNTLNLECFIAQSYSKNFGLYGERIGCLCVITHSKATTDAIVSAVCQTIRRMYSNPPSFGARIVAKILNDPLLFKEWEDNLTTMVSRIKGMRESLYNELLRLQTPGTWNHIVNQIGMFSYSGLNQVQSKRMKNDFHIYMTDNGRISMAGVTKANVTYLASCIDRIVRENQNKGSSRRMVSSSDEIAENEIISKVPFIFNEAQTSSSSHRRLCNELISIQTFQTKTNPLKMEEKFFLEWIKNLNHVLSLKKHDEISRRLMRFCLNFLYLSHEIATKPKKDKKPYKDGTHERFCENLLIYLLHGIEVKEKVTRYRLMELIKSCLNSLELINENVWNLLQQNLLPRLFDKDANIRCFAISACSRFQELNLEKDDPTVLISDIFIDLLRHDTSAEVRKSALNQLNVTEKTLPFILERCSDTDASVRKFLYDVKLQEAWGNYNSNINNLLDFRILSIRYRQILLKTGMNDRVIEVKEACMSMIQNVWLKMVDNNLVQFLELLDIVSEPEIAQCVSFGLYEKNPTMFTHFDEAYFQNLSVEMSFIAYSYAAFLLDTFGFDKVQELFPELSKMAAFLQSIFSNYVDALLNSDENCPDVEFILLQLLKIIGNLDFSDEIGRRVLFGTLRGMIMCTYAETSNISSIYIPENILTEIIALIRKLAISEQDFASLGLEIIATLNDSSFIKNEEIIAFNNIRSLQLTKIILSIVNESLNSLEILSPLLNGLVIPAINSKYANAQLLGLCSLGSFCFFSKDLTNSYIGLFCDFYTMGDEDCRIEALKYLFDFSMVFGNEKEFLDKCVNSSNSDVSTAFPSLFSLLSSVLIESDVTIQNIGVESLCKLILLKIRQDSNVLEGLLFLYFHHGTSKNARLRQCLSYFFHTFSFLSDENQVILAEIVPKVFYSLITIIENNPNDRETENALSISSIAMQMLYWTDSSKVYSHKGIITKNHHLDIAVELAILCLGLDTAKTKIIVSVLTKIQLSISESSQEYTIQIKKLLLVLGSLLKKTTLDKPILNNLKKLTSSLVELDDALQQLPSEVHKNLIERLKSN